MPEPVMTESGTQQPTVLAASSGRTADQDSIHLCVSRAVLNTPGVVRLEPTLSTAGPKILLHRSPADGIHVSTRANIIDIDINIATGTSHQARSVARNVHRKVSAEISKRGGPPGTVTVNVLTIDETDH